MEGIKIRTLKFRDVLWALGYKLGDEPSDNNFLTGRALALTAYINQWVRKLWDSQDWPEWTAIDQFTPNPATHIVAYGGDFSTPFDGGNKIGRALKVYLLDPETTPGPIETPFRLMDTGVHCGFEHGTNVWIKYLPPAPTFSATPWRAETRYDINELVYSPVTGECYKSAIRNNLGNDPASVFGSRLPEPFPPAITEPPTSLPSEVTQEFAAAVPSKADTDEVWRTAFDVPAWYNLDGTEYVLTFLDENAEKHGVIYTTSGTSGTIADVLNGLAAAIAAGDAFLTSLTVDIELPEKLKFTLGTAAFSVMATARRASDAAPTDLKQEHLSNYMVALSAAASTPQKTSVFLSKQQEGVPTVYELKITDAAGVAHNVTYESAPDEPLADTMTGLAIAINNAVVTDPFWGGVVLIQDAVNDRIEVATGKVTAVDATAVTAPYRPLAWNVVPFPLALGDPVIRGAYSDALREEGQTDKAAAEESVVPMESGVSADKKMTKPDNLMTDQISPKSRYKIA